MAPRLNKKIKIGFGLFGLLFGLYCCCTAGVCESAEPICVIMTHLGVEGAVDALLVSLHLLGAGYYHC